MKCLFTLSAFIFFFIVSSGQSLPDIRYPDKIRIREAINISEQSGNTIWKGIDAVPFVILFVTDSVEFLINHPYPTDDFKLLGNDIILKTNIYYRVRQFGKNLLATFPAVAGVSCIVVGTPENTSKNSSEWIITLLHEHFHQYQYSPPDYYKSVDSLDLAGGDQTGMWMLNYPFPYDSSAVIEQYERYNSALLATLLNINTVEFERSFNNYKRERNKFKQLLTPADYRYFSFQVWQEGIARYTEFKFLELLDGYMPSKEVLELKDFLPFAKYKKDFYESQLNELGDSKLKEDRRICFYSIGFAEGMLLDKLNSEWRDKYLTDKFFIENYSELYK